MADDPQAPGPKRRASPRRPRRTATAIDESATSPAPVTPEIVPAPVVTDPPPVVEDGTSVAAERVDLRQSAVGRIDASQVSINQGAVGAVRAERLVVERGAVGAALGEQIDVRQGYSRSIVARQVQLDRSAARVVIAADVQTSQTAVMFLVARKVAGDVRVLFDWRGALAFGAAAGVVMALVSRARRPRDGSSSRS
jgi:hypothetical protein